ncbi:acyl-CoA dehydrogenase family protein [Arthrobacter mobilis]|uniref:Acyl-CoA dehydrogenase n=1 Tax=Arthrobacter mobilis TaxID=2724944 RepID=A0A7X6K6S8_9MICC|nr:acyl-CoA dehydrogenase family protein [Arthrobacter mobilis]NKX55895.1 acyl-CoA dehydrogenase [Arthrobacter mobilis]
MKNQLSDEAVALGEAVDDTLAAAGGVDLTRRAEADPAARAALIGPLLEELGLWEIEPLADQVQLEAAAAACRAAGRHVLAYPIAERFAAPEGSEGLLLVPSTGRRVAPHADLGLSWSAVELTGLQRPVLSTGGSLHTKLGSFAGEVQVGEACGTLERETALLITLQMWWLLGVLERAGADTLTYVKEREQFGRTLAKFQSVQFTLTDLTVAAQSLAELAKYTLWSLAQDDHEPVWLTDALSLRLSGLEAADAVMRRAHQLHGAMGFADETNVSWYSRISQPVRRLPAGLSQTEAAVVESMGTDRFTNLFTPLPSAVRPEGALAH